MASRAMLQSTLKACGPCSRCGGNGEPQKKLMDPMKYIDLSYYEKAKPARWASFPLPDRQASVCRSGDYGRDHGDSRRRCVGSERRAAMGCFLTPDDLSKTTRASRLRNGSPIPTHAVTNGEFTPPPRSELQRRFEGRLRELAEPLARKQGMARRKFLKTAAGMAAAFVAMNEVFGPHFVVESAEAA